MVETDQRGGSDATYPLVAQAVRPYACARFAKLANGLLLPVRSARLLSNLI